MASGSPITFPGARRLFVLRCVQLVLLLGERLMTVGSYSAAASGAGGGRYVVTTGAIVYGLVRLVRGLARRK